MTDLAEAQAVEDHNSHDVPYGFYVLIWIALLILTQFTVTAAQLHIGQLGIVIAVIVTPIKAALVLYYFMHLRYEGLLFQCMFAFAAMSLVVAIGLTFFDYSFR
ncbi:cytochrome C oxidase subunit IV family protein [Oligoflexia bacterium]|nr:cytochrome C oxidase subunit IV family protein [Oligoflexia bacterium]